MTPRGCGIQWVVYLSFKVEVGPLRCDYFWLRNQLPFAQSQFAHSIVPGTELHQQVSTETAAAESFGLK